MRSIVDERDDVPVWLFCIYIDDAPATEVFGDKTKRNWVFWKLSELTLAYSDQGNVTVQQYANNEWIDKNDWAKLTH